MHAYLYDIAIYIRMIGKGLIYASTWQLCKGITFSCRFQRDMGIIVLRTFTVLVIKQTFNNLTSSNRVKILILILTVLHLLYFCNNYIGIGLKYYWLNGIKTNQIYLYGNQYNISNHQA